jgi:hypothetical protein
MNTTRFVYLSAFCLAVLAGCQRAADNSGTSIGMVQDAGGTIYDISCLRTNAEVIKSNGRPAMRTCALSAQTLTSSQAARLFKQNEAYVTGYYYYPPNYWNEEYASLYSSSYNNGAYNYSPYSTTSSSYEYNYLCSFIFGETWDASCYYNLFQYNPTSTSSYN